MRIARPTVSATSLAACCATFIVLADNRLFWTSLFKVIDPGTPHGALFTLASFVILAGTLSVLFLLVSVPRLFRPALMTALVLSAVVDYFGYAYGVVIDASMLQNVVATDQREAGELLTLALAVHSAVFGVLPAAAVGFVRIRSLPMLRELRRRLAWSVVILVLVGSAALLSYKDLALMGREHKELRMSANPLYPIYAAFKYARGRNSGTAPITQIGMDAHQDVRRAGTKRTVVILVVGETARAKEFSLNGYSRLTNPLLAADDVVSFTQAYACGTSTAESLPCMFSQLDRRDYSVEKAAGFENVLDVLARAGVSVFWRDNNSGCKGVCARVGTEDLSHASVAGLCGGEECFDEILLDQLDERIDRAGTDLLVVLHQKGSHGPAYFKRHPAGYTAFGPECSSDAPQNCRAEDIVNAYDNTILYTDHFLHRTIELLRRHAADSDAMLVYFSDHGESLGENGIYLHGLPYFIAPDEQKHVPFIVWLSDGYVRSNQVDRECLASLRDHSYSHSNIFHSLLGAFGVRTALYLRGKDVIASCRSG